MNREHGRDVERTMNAVALPQAPETSEADMIGGALIHDPSKALAFILAGNAYVTFRSEKTNVHYTYHVEANKKPATATTPVTHFVSVLLAPDKYEYIGVIVHGGTSFAYGERSRIGKGAKSVQGFIWVWRKLREGKVPTVLAVYHEGRCGRCGRRLTHPESIETGLGPECAKKSGGG